MLVLTRRTNESIIINENVEIVVLNVQGGRVRLGIEAPVDVPIHREELLTTMVSGITPRSPPEKRSKKRRQTSQDKSGEKQT